MNYYSRHQNTGIIIEPSVRVSSLILFKCFKDVGLSMDDLTAVVLEVVKNEREIPLRIRALMHDMTAAWINIGIDKRIAHSRHFEYETRAFIYGLYCKLIENDQYRNGLLTFNSCAQYGTNLLLFTRVTSADTGEADNKFRPVWPGA